MGTDTSTIGELYYAPEGEMRLLADNRMRH